MNIETINPSRKDLRKKLILATIANISAILMLLLLNEQTVLEVVSEISLKELMALVTVVILVQIVHELIHIVLFKVLAKGGRAKIKVERSKDVAGIVVRQVNPSVYYSVLGMVLVLLGPVIIITVSSYWIGGLYGWGNLILNTVGSTLDIALSIYLLVRYSGKSVEVHHLTEGVGLYIKMV